MKVKSTIVSTLVAVGLSVSVQAQAEESPVERLMSSLISNAVSVTQNEISAGIQQSIANMTYHFSADDEPTGTVKISDLTSQEVIDSTKQSAE